MLQTINYTIIHQNPFLTFRQANLLSLPYITQNAKGETLIFRIYIFHPLPGVPNLIKAIVILTHSLNNPKPAIEK
jgi:hypothetical protein